MQVASKLSVSWNAIGEAACFGPIITNIIASWYV